MRLRLGALVLLGLLAPLPVAGEPARANRDAAGRPKFVNALIRESSPYLLDAAHSPVQWLPYSDAAFERARAQGKPVFVSIGYFSCHWCHVMARESFDDPGIARVLNRGFIALKMDSEERPDIDRRFLARLEALGISPGWPMNFVLTPDDELVWGATYVGRDELATTLERLESRWKSDRSRILQLAAARERQARAAERPASTAANVADAYARLGARLVADFDPVHKGFGSGRKFHSPAQLGFQLDAHYRGAPGDNGRLFVETARAIAAGGVTDPIDGGVFRYSVARTWMQPHFERMLYDQAQVGRLMCQGYAISGDPALRRAASRILDFALFAFPTEAGLFAGSFDAESEGSEGGYYLWSESELGRLSPQARGALDKGFTRIPQASGSFLVVPGEAAGADSGPVLEELRAMRARRQAPRRDEKSVTAWNANMTATLAECAGLLAEERLATEAAVRMRRLLSTNAPGGRVHRYSIGGTAHGVATVEDLGWILAALVALHDADGTGEWIDLAKVHAAGLAKRDDATLARELADFARDRTGLSGSAVLLQALSRLARRTGDAAFETALGRIAALVRGFAGMDGAYSLTAALLELESPAPRRQADAAQGKVRLSVARSREEGPATRFLVTADIAPGWHINAHRPAQDYLRPTQIAVEGGDATVTYPQGKPLRFGPTGDTLVVLEGPARFEVRVAAAAPAPVAPLVRMKATIQACNTEVCLRPETVELVGTPAGGPAVYSTGTQGSGRRR